VATRQRIENLKSYCEEWKGSVIEAEARKDELIKWNNDGMSVTSSDSEKDLFPILIEEAEKAVEIYKGILVKMETLRDRAINGEDV
jgi:hypothetical protein